MSAKKQGRLIEHFVAGTTARAASEFVGMQANTVIRFYMRLRKFIAGKLPSYELSGEVEADESYFGGVRKGKRGRGAAGKIVVFGLLKRGGKVYTAIIPNAKTETLLPIIQGEDSTRQRGVHRHLQIVQCPGRERLSSQAHQPLHPICKRKKSYQRNREFLEPSQAPFEAFQ